LMLSWADTPAAAVGVKRARKVRRGMVMMGSWVAECWHDRPEMSKKYQSAA
jgi:hypothetical protein